MAPLNDAEALDLEKVKVKVVIDNGKAALGTRSRKDVERVVKESSPDTPPRELRMDNKQIKLRLSVSVTARDKHIRNRVHAKLAE